MNTPNDAERLSRGSEGSGAPSGGDADVARGRRPPARAVRTDLEARNRVVQANLGLVYRVARQYRDRGLTLEDLVGEGNLGLIRAAQEYDPRRGTRFSTYAYFWIREAIQSALANTAASIRVPMNVAKLMARWQRMKRTMKQERGRVPTFEEVADSLGLDEASREAVAQAIRAGRVQDQGGRTSEGTWWTISMADPSSSSSAEDIEERDEREAIFRRLEGLGQVERTIISLQYGLSGEAPMSFGQIGRRLGLTAIRVQRASEVTIRKLGHPPLVRRSSTGKSYCCLVG